MHRTALPILLLALSSASFGQGRSHLAGSAAHGPEHGNAAGLDTPEVAPRPLAGDRRSDVIVLPEPGAIWARGATYKASATADGFTYVPFLGSNAPRNWPVAFRVDAAAVGGQSLPLEHAAAYRADGDRFVLDRGAVAHAYDLRPNEVEQWFFVDTGVLEGELVLSVGVASDLAARPEGAGWAFEGPWGGVRYGAAFVLTPGGGRHAVRTDLREGGLELRVPAALVEASAGRVVIDPVVSTYAVATAALGDLENPDAAYDVLNSGFVYVYEDHFSNLDQDVVLERYDDLGALTMRTYLGLDQENQRRPSIATLRRNACYLVVAERGEAPATEIVGRVYDAMADAWSGPVFVVDAPGVSGGTSYFSVRPDAGGSSSNALDAEFVTAWERKFADGSGEIGFCTISASGTLGTKRVISTPGFHVLSHPAVSKSTGDTTSVDVWNLVFNAMSGPDWSIWGCQLRSNGTFLEFPQELHAVGAIASGPPAIDVSDALDLHGHDPTYAFVFPAPLTGGELVLMTCRNNRTIGSERLDSLEHRVGNTPTGRARLAALSDRFLVSYSDQSPGASVLRDRVFVTEFDLAYDDEPAVADRRVLAHSAVGTPFELRHDHAIASVFAAEGSVNAMYSVAAAWTDGGAQHGIDASILVSTNPQSPGTQWCVSPPNSTGERGYLRLEGDGSTTTPKVAVASHLPPGYYAVPYGGLGVSVVYNAFAGDGTLCIDGTKAPFNDQGSLVDPSGVKRATIDPLSLVTNTGTFPALSGMTYHMQMWHRDVVAGVGTNNLTNAVSLTFE